MNRRVCFVGAEITPSEGTIFVGGHVNTIVGLCKGLSNLGWEVHIVTTPSRFSRAPILEFPWAKFHLIQANGGYNSITYDLDFLRKAVQAISGLHSKYSFDLIHGHSGYFSLAIIPIIVKRRVGIPSLFSLYCPASMFPTRLPLDGHAIKVMCRSLDKIVAVTKNVRSSLLECGVDSTKVEVLPSCFDEQIFDISSYSHQLSDGTAKKDVRTQSVLFVGNVNRTKGLDIFLAAAKSVLRINPCTKFVITLHEPHKVIEEVKEQTSRLLGSAVDVLGVVENMPQLVANADVIVAPFRSTEGISDIPIIILEAMALGKPIIASDLGGIREAVTNRETGIILEENTPNELASSLIELLEDPHLRQKMGKEAIAQVKKFSYSDIACRLTNLYLQVCE